MAVSKKTTKSAKKESVAPVCVECNGTGRDKPEQTCPICNGTGK